MAADEDEDPYWKPQTNSSSTSKKRKHAANRAKILFGFYPISEASNPQLFMAGATAILAEYPEDVQDIVTGVKGLPARSKFLPRLSEIKQACEEEMTARAAKLEGSLAWQRAEAVREATLARLERDIEEVLQSGDTDRMLAMRNRLKEEYRQGRIWAPAYTHLSQKLWNDDVRVALEADLPAEVQSPPARSATPVSDWRTPEEIEELEASLAQHPYHPKAAGAAKRITRLKREAEWQAQYAAQVARERADPVIAARIKKKLAWLAEQMTEIGARYSLRPPLAKPRDARELKASQERAEARLEELRQQWADKPAALSDEARKPWAPSPDDPGGL